MNPRRPNSRTILVGASLLAVGGAGTAWYLMSNAEESRFAPAARQHADALRAEMAKAESKKSAEPQGQEPARDPQPSRAARKAN